MNYEACKKPKLKKILNKQRTKEDGNDVVMLFLFYLLMFCFVFYFQEKKEK